MNSKYQISVALIASALLTGCASGEKKHNEDSVQIPESASESEKTSSKPEGLPIGERRLHPALAELHEAYEDAELAQKALRLEMEVHTRLVEALAAKGDRSFTQMLCQTRVIKMKYARIVDVQHDFVRKVLLCSRKQKALGLEYKKERLIFEQTPADQKGRFYQLRWKSIKLLEDQQAEHSKMSLLLAKTHLLQAKTSVKQVSEFEELEREILEKLEK